MQENIKNALQKLPNVTLEASKGRCTKCYFVTFHSNRDLEDRKKKPEELLYTNLFDITEI